MAWIEKYKDRWFNMQSDTQCTACVAPWMDDSGWFVSNLAGGDVDGFKTAEEAMRFVDEHPDLFPTARALELGLSQWPLDVRAALPN